MNERFYRVFIRVAAVHGLILMAALLLPLIRGCRNKAEPHEMITYIDTSQMFSEQAVQPVDHIAAPEPLPEQQVPEAIPAPAAEPPTPKELTPPAPEPPQPKPKPKKKEIEKSTKRIHRPDAAPPKPALSEEQIRKMLEQQMPAAGTPSPPQTDVPFARYYAQVRQKLYAVWNQPAGMGVPAGITASVSIRVMKDGAVTRTEMVTPSGNRVMDESVMKAVKSVSKLDALPASFSGRYKDIVVEFELTEGVL